LDKYSKHSKKVEYESSIDTKTNDKESYSSEEYYSNSDNSSESDVNDKPISKKIQQKIRESIYDICNL